MDDGKWLREDGREKMWRGISEWCRNEIINPQLQSVLQKSFRPQGGIVSTGSTGFLIPIAFGIFRNDLSRVM
jgi:hypothetical protein